MVVTILTAPALVLIHQEAIAFGLARLGILVEAAEAVARNATRLRLATHHLRQLDVRETREHFRADHTNYFFSFFFNWRLRARNMLRDKGLSCCFVTK